MKDSVYYKSWHCYVLYFSSLLLAAGQYSASHLKNIMLIVVTWKAACLAFNHTGVSKKVFLSHK